ncbi:MAG: matrixin family metalloprotease [Planctomycetota bacterium]
MLFGPRSRKQFARHKPRSAQLRFEGLEERLVMYALTGYSWADHNVSASFLPDGTTSEGYVSNLYAELDAIASPEVWQREFARALQTWANVADLNFHFVADSGVASGTSGLAQGDSRFGDIRLGAHPLNSYVAYAYYPSSYYTIGGDITLNPNYDFHVGTHLDLFSVLVHESGHSLGLDHSSTGTIMDPYIRGVYSALTADDIAGIQAIYGARMQDSFDAGASNDTSATASVLAMATPGTVSIWADLTTMADVDCYRLTLPTDSDGTLTVSVDARGKSLLAPKISVYDTHGMLVATASAGSAYGTLATLSLTGLAPGQAYTLVADGATDDAFGMGAYRLEVTTVEGDPPPPPPPEIEADRFEVNDTMKAASNLARYSSVSETGLTLHTSSDVDYYRFRVSKSATYELAIRFNQSAGDLNLRVYDADQQFVASGATSADGESITLTLNARQNYYIRVDSPVGALNTYDLTVMKSAGGGGGGGGKSAASKGSATAAPEGCGTWAVWEAERVEAVLTETNVLSAWRALGLSASEAREYPMDATAPRLEAVPLDRIEESTHWLNLLARERLAEGVRARAVATLFGRDAGLSSWLDLTAADRLEEILAIAEQYPGELGRVSGSVGESLAARSLAGRARVTG